MKSILVLFAAISFNQVCLASPTTKLVSLRQKFADTEVDMGKGVVFDEARIIVPIEGSAPEVSIEESLATCSVVSVGKRGPRTLKNRYWEVMVSFEPEIDEGTNECVVTIRQPNGKTANVTLFIYVDG